MLTFKDIEKEKAKQGEDSDGISQSSSEKDRKKKLILYGAVLATALVAGYFIYTKVLVKKSSSSINSVEF